MVLLLAYEPWKPLRYTLLSMNFSGHEHVAEVLLRAGARWTILTKRLQTPYDLAVSRGLKIQALRIQEASYLRGGNLRTDNEC